MPLAAAPLAALITGVAGVGSAAIGSFAGGRTSTTSHQPTLSPKLAGLQNEVADSLGYNIQNPTAQTDALRIPAEERINSAYAGAPTALAAALGKRGFGSSGEGGGAYYNLETSRLSSLAGLEGTLATTNIENQRENLSLAERLTSSGAGSTSTTVGPNNGPSNGLSTLTTLFTLNKLLKNGNGNTTATKAPPPGQGAFTGSNDPGVWE